MVTAAELIEVPELRFVEPSFAELTDEIYSSVTPEFEATDGRLLVDENDDPIAIALRDDDAWNATTFLYRTPSVIWLERFEETGGAIYQEPRETWARAVRAHYAERIRAEVLPAANDLPSDRFAKARELVVEHLGVRDGVPAIDACCGSGIGAAVLRSIGMAPLSYDNDAALIALGLAEGRLLSEEVCCIDGAFATDYIDPAPVGLALMVGQCYPGLNDELWRELVLQLLALSDETLITLGTEPEAALVAGWIVEAGRGVEVVENERDPIYDRWVCLASR
ncbi:MAG: hypothetical protein ABFC89_13155 [Methanospirillum sp.]